MFDALTALGYGIVIFALTVGIGVVILSKFSVSSAECTSPWSTYNASQKLCTLAADSSNTTAPSAATVNVNYLTTQLGETGLAGWTPAIIAMAVGLLFLGSFLIGKSGRGRY